MGRSSTQRLRMALGVVVGRGTKQSPVSFCRGLCRCKRNQFQPTKAPRCRYPALQRSHTSKNWQGPSKNTSCSRTPLVALDATPQSSNTHLLPQRVLTFTPYSGELHRFGLSNNLSTASSSLAVENKTCPSSRVPPTATLGILTYSALPAVQRPVPRTRPGCVREAHHASNAYFKQEPTPPSPYSHFTCFT